MKNRFVKKIFIGILSVAVIGTMFTFVSNDTNAASTSTVKYQLVDYNEFKDCIYNSKAPECKLTDDASGYLFAGWYKQSGSDALIVESSENIGESESKSILAKFVPARLTGVYWQNRANVNESNVSSTDLRMVSTVDSLNYKEVGFNVYGREKNPDGTYSDWLMYGYNTARELKSTKAYTGLNVYHVGENGALEQVGNAKTPADLYGQDAADFKFTTASLTGIPKDAYETIVAVKPYWVTLDGTYVEGIGEFNRVQDGIDGIINVSVNVREADPIAAGMLSVSYKPANFECVEVECGKVFEEMNFNVDKETGTVTCVGNVLGSTDNANPNDVYVNLRMKKTDTNNLAAGAAEFNVTTNEKSFCNISEQFVTNVQVWDVRY